jgi:ribosomal protein S18 acetylase RimI-like enzyme
MSGARFDPGFSETLMSRVEDAGLNASAPPGQLWIDGWLVRSLPGKARRARCINALAPGRLPAAEKMALAAEVYRAAGLPMIFRLHRFTVPAGLDAELEQLGWTVVDHTTVMIRPTVGNLAEPKPPAGLHLQPLDGAAFAEAVGALRGTPADQCASHALRLQHSPVPYRGFALRRLADGQIMACGQFAREGALVGLYDVFTHPEARGRGLAGLLCEHMLTVSATEGAKTAYLQVDAANAPAIAVYRRLGFAAAYGYHYRDAPGGNP